MIGRKKIMTEELNVNAEAQTNTEPSGEGEQAVEKKPVSGEAKPVEKSDSAEKPAEEKPKPEVPESYEFPEDLKLTEEEKTKYTELLRKHGATQEAANDLIEHIKQQAKAVQEASVKAWYDQVKKWGEEAEQHKEYGGPKFEENLKTVIIPVLNKFGDEQLIQELDQTGFGNNPRLLAFLYRVGKEIGTEAKFVEGRPGIGDEDNILKTLYPTMFKDKQ
jgi:FtsZ-interacting cell division protein ZipA